MIVNLTVIVLVMVILMDLVVMTRIIPMMCRRMGLMILIMTLIMIDLMDFLVLVSCYRKSLLILVKLSCSLIVRFCCIRVRVLVLRCMWKVICLRMIICRLICIVVRVIRRC